MIKNQKDQFNKIYKWRQLDFGLRLTNLILLPYDQALGIIYQGLYYDSSECATILPRYVYLSKETLDKDWELTD